MDPRLRLAIGTVAFVVLTALTLWLATAPWRRR
jgi:hypothetical protein